MPGGQPISGGPGFSNPGFSNPGFSNPVFSSLAAGYAWCRPAIHPRVIERIEHHLRLGADKLQPGQKIARALDVGCGAGLSTQPLGRLAAQIFGIDAAEAMLARASSVAPHAHFAAGRAEALPIRSGSIGLIAAAGSLNYADVDLFFSEAARVLAPGGELVVYDFSPGRAFPDSASLDEWFGAFMRRYPPPRDEALELSPQRLAQLTGLFHVQSHEDFEIPLSLSPAFYLDYVLTETNVACAVTDGVPLEEIRAWCEDTIEAVFEGRDREVLFRGYIAYMVAA
jgi:ubiquinone/menaquinone biosynthesis C-methylase UbiE